MATYMSASWLDKIRHRPGSKSIMALLRLELTNKILAENWLVTRALFEEELIVSFRDDNGKLKSLIEDNFVAHLLKVHSEACDTCPESSRARPTPRNQDAVPAGIFAGAGDGDRPIIPDDASISQSKCVSNSTKNADGTAGLRTIGRPDEVDRYQNEALDQVSTPPSITSDNEQGKGYTCTDETKQSGVHDAIIKREVQDEDYVGEQPIRITSHCSSSGMQSQLDSSHLSEPFLKYGEYFQDKFKTGSDGSKSRGQKQVERFPAFKKEPMEAADQPHSAAEVRMEIHPSEAAHLRNEGRSLSHKRNEGVEDSGESSGLVNLEDGNISLSSSSDDFTKIITPRSLQAITNSVPDNNASKSDESISSISNTCNEGLLDGNDFEERQGMNKEDASHPSNFLEHLRGQEQQETHQSLYTGKGFYVCTICGKNFSKGENLTVHMRIHTGEKPYPCSFCGKRFRHSQTLNDHVRTHTGEMFHCEVCGKGFAKNENLKLHMRIHTGELPYECSECGKRYRTHPGLILHAKTHTGERFPCSICGKTLTQKASLKEHMKIHTGEKPYECQFCGKRFRQNQVLSVHIRTHTGEKYQCSICGKSFSQKGTLREHMTIHTGQKCNYECSVCKKTFTTKRSMTTHMRMHTGENLYHCSFCEKSFTAKNILTRHERIHTGEKPFQCSVCDKAFTVKQQLTKHVCRPTKEKNLN